MHRRRRFSLVAAAIVLVSASSSAQRSAGTSFLARRADIDSVAPIRANRSIAASRALGAVDRIRLAREDTLLPILDDAGLIITEAEIRAAMTSGGKVRSLAVLAGALVGMGVFDAVLPDPKGGADCSDYEPCTEREEFYRTFGLLTGGAVGALIMSLGPEWGRDRYRAVEYIRAQRRLPAAPR